jgi:outer membrane protein TolC
MGPLTLLAVLRLAEMAGPLTLDDALALAARRNAELAIARSDQESAAADARQSYQGVLPRLDLSGNFGRQFVGAQEQVNVVPNPTPPPDFVRVPVTSPAIDFAVYELGLTLTWTFFDGLASWRFIDSSRARAEAARRQVDESGLRVAFEVARRFYDVLKQQRALEVLRETASLSADLVKRADALFAAGRGTKADTYSARVNHGNDQIAVRAQAAELVRARTDFAVVLGLTSEAGLELALPAPLAGPGLPAVEEPPALPDLLASARKSRPLLTAQRLSEEAADLEISRARGAYWPILGVLASYRKQALELGGTDGLFGDPSHQYIATAQVTLSWNLFAGGETREGVRRAQAQALRAQALLEQAEQTVSAEVASARARVEELARSVAISRENLDAAERGLRFARERLEAGVGSQLEVRDATLKLSQAKVTAFDTVADLVVARADLNRAVGGTL